VPIITGEIILKAAGWIIGIVGTLITLCGVLIGYIFRRHERDNDVQFSNNREDHQIIFDRLERRKRNVKIKVERRKREDL
jgi:hypothetical protein